MTPANQRVAIELRGRAASEFVCFKVSARAMPWFCMGREQTNGTVKHWLSSGLPAAAWCLALEVVEVELYLWGGLGGTLLLHGARQGGCPGCLRGCGRG
eukprot:scaffold314798_cov22-Prasinocladus_malaysianus.AAC.1